MAKAPTNYAKLAEQTELVKFGLEAKIAQVDKQIKSMLKDVPERAAIMQSIERYANWAGQLAEVNERYDRYVALRDRPAESNGETQPTN